MSELLLSDRLNVIEKNIQILNDGLGKLFAIEDKKNKKARKKLKRLIKLIKSWDSDTDQDPYGIFDLAEQMRKNLDYKVSQAILDSCLKYKNSDILSDKLDGNVSPFVELGKDDRNIVDNRVSKEPEQLFESVLKIDSYPTVYYTQTSQEKLVTMNIPNPHSSNVSYLVNGAHNCAYSDKNNHLTEQNAKLLTQIDELKSEIAQLQESNLTLSNQVSYHG